MSYENSSVQKMNSELWQIQYCQHLGSYLISESDESQWQDDMESMPFSVALEKLVHLYEEQLDLWRRPTPDGIAASYQLTPENAAELIAKALEECATVLSYIRDVKTPEEYVEAFESCRKHYLEKGCYVPPEDVQNTRFGISHSNTKG